MKTLTQKLMDTYYMTVAKINAGSFTEEWLQHRYAQHLLQLKELLIATFLSGLIIGLLIGCLL